MTQRRSVHAQIIGRVQGVGYRAWLAEEAAAQELTGWVRNRHDGTVEAVLQGAPDNVAKVLSRCEQGPLMAEVDRIEILAQPVEFFQDFQVRATV